MCKGPRTDFNGFDWLKMVTSLFINVMPYEYMGCITLVDYLILQIEFDLGLYEVI
jgi:hypothetical protein